MLDLRMGVEQVTALLRELTRLQEEHPKANVYFDGKEIRVTYPLPKDFSLTVTGGIINNPPTGRPPNY